MRENVEAVVVPYGVEEVPFFPVDLDPPDLSMRDTQRFDEIFAARGKALLGGLDALVSTSSERSP